MSIDTNERVIWRFRNGHGLGEFGEALWSRIFLGSGMLYIPLKDLPPVNRKGPRMQGNDTILPDFDVSAGKRAYVDSKCKTKPVLYRVLNQLRHGIDRKDWEAYDAIGGIQRQKVVLAITECFKDSDWNWSGSLLAQTLGKLGRPMSGTKSQSHMVYWPRDSFHLIAESVAPLVLWRISTGEHEVPRGIRLSLSELFGSREPAIQSRMF